MSDQKGSTLAESLIAISIVAIAIIPFLAAFSTASINIRNVDRQVTAENLARSQMEYTKSLTYLVAPASYATFSPIPSGYSVASNATTISGRDGNIQRITVVVEQQGTVLVTLDDFKLNR